MRQGGWCIRLVLQECAMVARTGYRGVHIGWIQLSCVRKAFGMHLTRCAVCTISGTLFACPCTLTVFVLLHSHRVCHSVQHVHMMIPPYRHEKILQYPRWYTQTCTMHSALMSQRKLATNCMFCAQMLIHACAAVTLFDCLGTTTRKY